MSDEPRKAGSTALGIVTGVALVIAAIYIRLGLLSGAKLKSHAVGVEAGSCVVFAVVLFWWAVSDKKGWGIGFPTVTMVFAVITALIAILTLIG